MADVKFTLDADTAKAVKGILKVMDANQKTEKSFDRTTKSMKNQGGQFAEMGRDIASFVKSTAGVAAILAGLTAAFRKMAEERRKAAESVNLTAFSTGSLAQLAGGDTGEFKRLVGLARDISKRAGVDESIAAQVQFSLTSLGVGGKEGIRDEIIGLIKSGVIAPEEASPVVRSVGVLQTAFGKEEAGSAKQVLAKVLRASSVSQVSFTEFAPSATITAQEARTIGASDEETLALISVLGNAFKSPDVAATTLSSLTASIRKQGLGGRGFLGALPDLISLTQGKTEAEIIKLFGRKEAERAFSAIRANLPAIQAEIAAQEEVDRLAGTQGGLVARTIGLVGADPQLSAAASLRVKTQEEALLLKEEFGAPELLRQEALKDVNIGLMRRGIGPFQRSIKTGVTGFLSENLNLSPETTRFIGLSGTEPDSPAPDLSQENDRGGDLSPVVRAFQAIIEKFEKSVDKFDQRPLRQTQTE